MAHYSKVSIGAGNYRSYVAQLTQGSSSPTAPPVATVLNNTLGYTPSWSRSSAGLYILNATEFATEYSNKVFVLFTPANYALNYTESSNIPRVEALWSQVNNQVILRTGYMSICNEGGCSDVAEFILSDNRLNSEISGDFFKASFELRIYN